jgi:dTDP-glucose pyrophosphorylase
MSKIQLVVPMAGRGSRFTEAGYQTLKPLLPIHGEPMVSVVLKNLFSEKISDVILVCQRETFESTDLRAALSWLEIPLTILCVDEITEGPADTVKVARIAIREHDPLVIANSDQYLNCSMETFYSLLEDPQLEGAILTMQDDNPKWSFAEIDENGFVMRVKEKEVISNHATVGIYGYTKAIFAWEAFQKMWTLNDRTNGEFYVAPSYNYLEQKKSRIVDLGPINEIMFGLGIPEDYENFCANEISKSFVHKNFKH